MAELIITTQNELKLIIESSIADALNANLSAAKPTEPTPNKVDELLTRQEAAKLLGVSLVTLNEWSKKGIVVGYRIASRVRYKKTELEQSLVQMQTTKNWRAA